MKKTVVAAVTPASAADADVADRDRVDDAEQLIAEHLHGKRQR